MKAIVYERYGPPEVLELRDVPKPVPKDNELLIRIRATTVSSGDWRARSLSVPRGFGPMARLVFGVFRPRHSILGTELSGEVEAVGSAVTRFAPGDAVVAYPGAKFGCHAEYRTMPEDGAVTGKPDNLTFEEAAALCFGGTTALHFLGKADIKAGDKVLINGASGSVGSAAVQLAKHLGAHVTGVTSTSNLDLVRSIGADAVVDYTKEDFAAGGERYDIVMDTAGTAPFPRSEGALKEGGRLLLVMAGFKDTVRAPLDSRKGSRKVIAGPAAERSEDVRRLSEIAAAGAYRPVIDRVYPLEQAVEAHRHVDQGHKRGNVVLTVGQDRVG